MSIYPAQGALTPPGGITVTMLGTGTPFPDSDRYGSAILVEAAGKHLLFDCGRGAVVRLWQVGRRPNEIDGVFLTHLHSDHIVGIPDVWLTGWFLGRDHPLPVWGPAGTRSMAEHLEQAFAFDLRARAAPPESLSPSGAVIAARDIEEGTVYADGSLRASAFLVDHGAVGPTFGYRVDYGGHAVVISGDTRFSQNLVDHAKGVDCLIHVAWTVGALNPTPPAERSLASAEDVARIFSLVGPKLGVIYHYRDQAGMADVIRAAYSGPFVIAKDLLTIDIGLTITWRERGAPP